MTRWVVEGNSEVQANAGRVIVRKLPDVATTATLWYQRELPENVFIKYTTKPIPPEDENACNLNAFIHARESDGGHLKFTRSGVYKEYHQIPNYIMTFVGGVMPGWSRLRRDPGFHLVSESEIRSEVGKEYEIIITVLDGRIRCYINGEKIHDFTDPEPLPGGWFGIRTWSTNAWWKDVQFGEINEPGAGS